MLTKKTLEYLTEYKKAALVAACNHKKVHIAHELIDSRSVGLDYVGNGELTALMQCIANHMTSIALKLIKNGVNLDHRTSQGDTALSLACRYGEPKVAMAILESNPREIDGKDTLMRTPLTEACRDGLSQVALTLIERGADPGNIDGFRQTPLLYACEKGMTDVSLALVATGKSQPNHRYLGETAFRCAIQNNMVVVIKELAKIIDPNQYDLYYETPRLLAEKNGFGDLFP